MPKILQQQAANRPATTSRSAAKTGGAHHLTPVANAAVVPSRFRDGWSTHSSPLVLHQCAQQPGPAVRQSVHFLSLRSGGGREQRSSCSLCPRTNYETVVRSWSRGPYTSLLSRSLVYSSKGGYVGFCDLFPPAFIFAHQYSPWRQSPLTSLSLPRHPQASLPSSSLSSSHQSSLHSPSDPAKPRFCYHPARPAHGRSSDTCRNSSAQPRRIAYTCWWSTGSGSMAAMRGS